MVDKFSDGSNCQYITVTAYIPSVAPRLFTVILLSEGGNHTDSSISHPGVIAEEFSDEPNCQYVHCPAAVQCTYTLPLSVGETIQLPLILVRISQTRNYC